MNATAPVSVASPAAPFDSRSFRNALGSYATGVTVVTALGPDGRPLGLTVNSFSSVSLEPALILWSLAAQSPSREAFVQASHFAVNVLALDQEALSNRFASRAEDKFADLDWAPGLGGAPLLPGCCATFQCVNEARHPGGDHLIFIGRVEAFEHQPERLPLVFQGGAYRQLAPLGR